MIIQYKNTHTNNLRSTYSYILRITFLYEPFVKKNKKKQKMFARS